MPDCFSCFGVDLVTIRWALYGAALLSTFVWYCIASHFARPLPAAAAAMVALVWGFPNYFAGLPSWWVLLFASLAVLALMRFHHTGRTRWLFLGGSDAGARVCFQAAGGVRGRCRMARRRRTTKGWNVRPEPPQDHGARATSPSGSSASRRFSLASQSSSDSTFARICGLCWSFRLRRSRSLSPLRSGDMGVT